LKTVGEIRSLVAYELSIITNPARRGALEQLLIAPVIRERDWDYKPPDQRYTYWCVAEAHDREIELAYCEHGFGPTFPWGWLYKRDPTFGNDGQWNWYLEEAFVRSGLWLGYVGGLDEEAFRKPPEERFPNG